MLNLGIQKPDAIRKKWFGKWFVSKVGTSEDVDKWQDILSVVDAIRDILARLLYHRYALKWTCVLSVNMVHNISSTKLLGTYQRLVTRSGNIQFVKIIDWSEEFWRISKMKLLLLRWSYQDMTEKTSESLLLLLLPLCSSLVFVIQMVGSEFSNIGKHGVNCVTFSPSIRAEWLNNRF